VEVPPYHFITTQLTAQYSPGASFLIHFKSYDLTRLQKQGQFWHIFFTKGATIIAQDEECMWTIHVPVDIDADISQIDPVMAVYEGLGGEFAPFEIKIDEIFVTSKWRPNIYLANRYTSASGRVFISGDAAHQNIPTGGYGMNTAVGDSFDIGWKVAAAVKGHGGKFLLKSYELERRPVGARNIERSGVHAFVHVTYRQWCAEAPEVITSAGEDGVALREKIRQHVETNNGENTNYGIEMDYRYTGSPVVVSDTDGSQEPAWTPTAYTPSTWPGARAPQVILADGKTSIFDLFGRGNKYSLVDFTPEAAYVQAFRPVAESLKIPLEFIHLPEEKHVREIWGRDSVFVRPDDHVAWRAPSSGASAQGLDVEHILLVATGQREAEHIGNGDLLAAPHSAPTFTGTVGNVEHNKVEGLGAFQT
jgi:FAD-dependent monooxygenase